MTSRINRAIELLAEDQPIYYLGGHTGHVLTYEQGKQDAATWADYINVGMEHGCFDMTGLAHYLKGMVDGGPTTSGHRTPAVVVEAVVNGTDEANVRFNSWQFRQILARGVHGILLCQAETAGGGAGVRRGLPLSAPERRGRPLAAHPDGPPGGSPDRRRGRQRGGRPGGRAGKPLLGLGMRGGAPRAAPRPSGGSPADEYLDALRPVAAQPRRRAAAGGQAREPGGGGQLRGDPGRARPRASPSWARATSASRSGTCSCRAIRIRRRWRRPRARASSPPAGPTASPSSKAAPRTTWSPGSTRGCG